MSTLLPGDNIGDPLPLGFASETLFEFKTPPKFASGKAPTTATVLPLNDPSFTWRAAYVHCAPSSQQPASSVSPWLGMSRLGSERAAYPSGDLIAKLGISPFSSDGESLLLTVSPMPAAAIPYIPPSIMDPTPLNYWSGAINSYPYGFTYGYTEAVMKIPAGPGLWPAFWLLPIDGAWPPEIDVVETRGQDPTTEYVTLHANSFQTTANPSTLSGAISQMTALRSTSGVDVPVDLSLDYHAFGLDWSATRMAFYLDRRLTASFATPPEMVGRPFYLIANLTVGGWGGTPDASTPIPASLHLASIFVGQRA